MYQAQYVTDDVKQDVLDMLTYLDIARYNLDIAQAELECLLAVGAGCGRSCQRWTK
jgi:hypothetical protein